MRPHPLLVVFGHSVHHETVGLLVYPPLHPVHQPHALNLREPTLEGAQYLRAASRLTTSEEESPRFRAGSALRSRSETPGDSQVRGVSAAKWPLYYRPMALWYTPTPSPYRPHDPSFRQPLYLHLAPLWRELKRALGGLDGSVLDVGCGARPYRELLGAGVTRYVGFDLESTLPRPDVTGDAHALPFERAEFDAVVSMQVLEHVVDPARCVREMARVLKPDGVVLITVPGVWPAHEIPNDYWRFTRYGVERMLRDAGLPLCEMVALGGLWSTLGQMANLELERTRGGRAVIPLVNLAAGALDRSAKQSLVMNWLARATRAS